MSTRKIKTPVKKISFLKTFIYQQHRDNSYRKRYGGIFGRLNTWGSLRMSYETFD